MTRVDVRTDRGDIDITFSYEGSTVTLQRKESEQLSATMTRVALSCKKRRNQQQPLLGKDTDSSPSEPIAVAFEGPEGIFADDARLGEAMKTATSMLVGNCKYTVFVQRLKEAKLSQVWLPKSVLATCPVTARVQSDVADYNVEWFIEGQEEPLGSGLTFVPSIDMGGRTLTARLSLPEESRVDTACCAVTKWSDEDVFSSDRLAPFVKSNETIRVMSFNVLAPMYLRRKDFVAATYPYCPQAQLEWEYRFPLIAKEIRAIDPDICCLQEVATLKCSDLDAVFPPSEFERCFWAKQHKGTEDRSEGCALYLRKELFELRDTRNVALSEEMLGHTILGQAWEDCSWAPTVRTVLQNIGTVAQICTVKDKRTGKLLVVTNTHLFYHPQASHIRLLQISKLLELVTILVEELDATPIIVGDLNAMPKTAAFRFLRENEIRDDDIVWRLCEEFEWAKSREMTPEKEIPRECEIDGLHLRHGLSLTHCFPDLTWTTLCEGFNGFLDHILVGPGATPTQALGVPDIDYIKERYGGLPNRCYGSDHMSVAVDLLLQ